VQTPVARLFRGLRLGHAAASERWATELPRERALLLMRRSIVVGVLRFCWGRTISSRLGPTKRKRYITCLASTGELSLVRCWVLVWLKVAPCVCSSVQHKACVAHVSSRTGQPQAGHEQPGCRHHTPDGRELGLHERQSLPQLRVVRLG
jgi:hypothetical protein